MQETKSDLVSILSSKESCKSYLKSLQVNYADEKAQEKYGKCGLFILFSQGAFIKNKKPLNNQLLLNYRDAFVSFVQDEVNKKAKGAFYGSTKELYTFVKLYNTLQFKNSLSKKTIELWLGQQTFVEKILPLLIIASRNPELSKQASLYDNSVLFASAANPHVVNALIYGSDEFASLEYLNKYTKKEPLIVGSVVKNIIDTIKDPVNGGYSINDSFELNKQELEVENANVIMVFEQTPETDIEYLKTCFKPRLDTYSFEAMSDEFKKKFITFLMCMKLKGSQQSSFKVPKMVIKNEIFTKVAPKGRAHCLQSLFKTDIQRCKVLTSQAEENPALKKMFDFLYNDFDAWFKQEMDML